MATDVIDGRAGSSKLRPMPYFRRHSAPSSTRLPARRALARPGMLCALTTAVLAALLLASCERRQAVPAIDSTMPLRPAPVGRSASAAASTWDDRLGPVLLVGASSAEQATIVVPDSAPGGVDSLTQSEAIAVRSSPATLLGHGDSVQIALLQERQSERGQSGEECTGWPLWHLSAAPPRGGTLASWSVGFVGASVLPVPLDSVENLTRSDSARLAAEVTRLASTLPNTGDRFVGLPFTVTSLWRFHAGPGVAAVAAELMRRVNQEARPWEERTLLIAERDSTRRDERFTLAYYTRSQGTEESIESDDVVGGARSGPSGEPMLVIAHDYGDGMSYSLVERDPSGRWRERWRSARGKCK